MVNVEKVYGLLNNLESALGQLRQLAITDREKFLTDGLVLGAAKYYLQTAIEACIDIGNHIISSERYFEAYMRWISDFLKGVALTQ
jgi:uncharacterized protein YutE (UPF0331/DUF86 family)